MARNCLVADAHRWGYFSVCGLLMRLREHYKWERGLAPWGRVETAEILPWVGEREAAWAGLEDAQYRPLLVGAVEIDPYDEDGVNARTLPEGWLYAAGHGPGGLPLFVLGAVEGRAQREGAEVFVLGRELVRDLVPVPAMCRPGRVVARRRVVLEHLWTTLEETALRPDGPAAAALRDEGAEPAAVMADPAAHAPLLESLAARELDSAVLHELGELAEDRRRGGRWELLLLQGAGTKAEILGRALKDCLADAGDGGVVDVLLRERRRGSLALHAAAGHGMRRKILPELREVWELARDGRWDEAESARRAASARLERHLEAFFGICAGGGSQAQRAAHVDAWEEYLFRG